MREILFRGKRIDNGEWVYGYPVGWQNEGGDISIVDSRFGACIDESGNLMMLEAPFVTKVDPATVGQCTGLTDKNGKRIFEGDIVKCTNYHGAVEGNVDYSESLFYLACSSGYSDEYLFNCSDIEVIGNIHDKEDSQA